MCGHTRLMPTRAHSDSELLHPRASGKGLKICHVGRARHAEGANGPSLKCVDISQQDGNRAYQCNHQIKFIPLPRFADKSVFSCRTWRLRESPAGCG